MCVYLYIQNNYTQHTQIYYENTNFYFVCDLYIFIFISGIKINNWLLFCHCTKVFKILSREYLLYYFDSLSLFLTHILINVSGIFFFYFLLLKMSVNRIK